MNVFRSFCGMVSTASFVLLALLAFPIPKIAHGGDIPAARFTGVHSRTSETNPATAYCDFGRGFSFRLFSPTNAAVDVSVGTDADSGSWNVSDGTFTYSPKLFEDGSIRSFTFTLKSNEWTSEPKTVVVKV